MPRNIYYFLFLLFVSCNDATTTSLSDQPMVTGRENVYPSSLPGSAMVAVSSIDTLEAEEDFEEQTVTCWLVIADTSDHYSLLRDKMILLKEQSGLEIDTMGRSYNSKKDLISLPEDDEDEIYAGDYFPRRSTSENLSLEYLSFYKDNISSKSIALVSGIYEQPGLAENGLKMIRAFSPSAFILKTKIYMGCMH